MKKYLLLVILSLVSSLIVNAQCNTSTDVTGATGQAGLYGEYFAGYFNDNPSFFPATVGTAFNRVETNINRTSDNWGVPRPPATGTATDQNTFSARYRGSINITTAGTYTFSLNSDDASYMFIDNDALTYPVTLGSALISNGGAHSDATVSASVYLTVGYHNIQILYGENTGDNVIGLRWTGPAGSGITANSIVPNSVLCTGIQPVIVPGTCNCMDSKGNAATSGLLGEYYAGYFNDVQGFFTTNTPAITRVDNVVNFNTNWGTIIPPATNTVADPDYFSVRWTGSFNAPSAGAYTFYLTSDDASYLWLDDAAVTTTPTTGAASISNGGLHGNTTVAATVTLTAGIHYIKIHYGENAGGNVNIFEVESATAGITRQVVPNSMLCTSFLPNEPIVTTPVTYCQNATATALTATGTALKWYTTAIGGTGTTTAPIPLTTTVGTTSYYVSQTVGTCESLRAKIDVVVTPPATITRTSAAATTAQTVCINTVIAPIIYTLTNSTGATVTGLPTGVTGAYLAGIYTISGTPTVAGTYSYTVTATGCSSPTATGTITVTPATTITLSSAAGTDAQTVCNNVAITDITYAVGGTGATILGLPAGVTGTFAAGVFTISGTPTANGTFNYTVTATGCGIATATGSIVVTPLATITLTSAAATAAQTVCINTAITNIRYTIANGTGATITGLPTGVTGTYAAGVVNINGTPTVSGLFSYTVTATGCGSPSLSGTITVTPTPTITLSSAAGTDAQTVCNGIAITNITYSVTDGTTATVTGLPTGVTGAYNAGTGVYTISGTPSANGTFNYTVTANGCGSITATGTIVVNPAATITFSSAAGTDAQTVCINTAIANIAYTITNGTGATVTGLPTGVTSLYNAGTGIYTITGTPTVSGSFSYTITTTGCASPTATGTITVNPTTTVALSSAAGTDAQTVCTNTAITNITYAVTNGTGASVTGLPAGVTGAYAAGVFTISGTPTASGTFNYTVTGAGCGTPTATGTIIVNPATTVALSSAAGTDAQTVCINTAITNITYAITNGTGATVTGLPAGVTGSYAAGVFTISGTPSASGSFSYTVTGAGCGTPTATGTITVNPNATITLSSAVGTNTQTVCINTAITNIAYTINNGTGATVTGLPAGVTGTFAAGVFTISGMPSASGTFTYTVTAAGGCTSPTAGGTITVNPATSIALTSATGTDAQTVCINTAITNITYSITNGTGASYAGLPAGLTGVYSAGVFTISGSPTASGTFNYTVTATGTCGTPSVTGTIIVNPNTSVVLSSAAGTNAQTICINTALTNIDYTIVNGTGATVTGLPTGVTGTYAAGIFTISGTPTVSGTFNYTVTGTGCGTPTGTGTIRVNPATTVALSSAAGTDAQTLCVNTGITNITYTITNGTGATVTGLPAGVTGSYAAGTYTISGTALVSGTFNYTVTGTGCAAPTATGTITVNPNTTVALSSAAGTNAQTVCINTAITNITYAVTNGTGATVTGLPAGVTGSYAAGVLTISGTPSASGTYNYTVTATGGCTSPTATGTITVNPTATIALSSTAGTDAQTLCINTAITNITYDVTNGTGATVIGLPAGVTGSYAAGVFTISGTPTASGTFNYTVTATGGCTSPTATGTITVNPTAIIALSSVTGTDGQTVCINTAIANIAYTITNGTGVTITGLPTGVAGLYNAGTGIYTISGTPSASGTFNYTVTATGGCTSPTATGTIIVNPNAIIALSSATGTDGQTLCINTALTNITYDITNGTGATVTGLPAGVTGNYAAGVFTISGTPTASGTFNYTVTATGGCTSPTATGTITVSPTAIIALSSATGTDGQTVCINTALTNITYDITNGTGATVTGLPAGVTGNYAAGVFTISGTPTASGTFNYTVTATGGCTSPTATGTITVNPNAIIALSSATGTDGQTLCINTALTNITYDITNGTGATVTGLPAGVTGSYAAGVFTLSGTPTASGTFNYTVTATGGCTSPTATGTITVSPTAIIALSSATGTDGQTVCINTALTNITYDITNGTGATVTGLPAGVTGNYAAGVFTISGTPTASGTFNYTVTATGGCSSPTATGTITVNPNATIALSSVTGTDAQTLCINSATTNITYDLTDATGATVTGLPAGVTGSYAAGVFTISGTPTASGTFNYTVTATGGCTSPTATGTIIVNPDPTITLSSATGTNAQTVCINTVITNITYAVANGTGATITGLPAGVTGSYAAGVFTISGTPTAAGTFNYTITVTGGCTSPTATGTIIVNPNATIALSSATGTDAQTLCISNAITNITYDLTDATGATVTGLPAGITGSYAAGVFTLSGTPTASGTFNYTVTATGGCTSPTATGTIIVNPDATVTLSSAAGTNAQTICINNAITSITYAIADATNAGVTGLPTGVTGSYAAGVFTITGTPTVSGTFNYTVTATGGCSSPTANGTITVNPDATIVLGSATGTDAQAICINTAITAITYTITDATGATITGLPAGVTGSYVAGVFTISGTPTVAGTFNYTVTVTGCSAPTATGSIVVTPTSNATISYAGSPMCTNAGLQAVTRTGTAGGTYTSITGLTLDGTTGEIDPSTSTAGPYVVTYTVPAIGGCPAFSTTANVVINLATVITTHPADQTVCQNTTANFSVVATGTGLTYQWRKNGGNIAGETASTFSIPSTAVTDAGNYDVVISSSCGGSVTSNVAVLTILTNPTYTMNPYDTTVCENTAANIRVGATGTNVTYQWYKGLTPIAGADSSVYYIPSAAISDAGSYYVVISGTCGMPLSSTAAILTVNSNPVIVTDPTDIAMCENGTATFSVSATGSSLTYQWRKGGIDIAGATSTSYSINPVSVADAGTYDVTVTSVCGAPITSATATLVVNSYTTPTVTITSDDTDNNICGGTTVVFTPTVNNAGTTPTYQWYLNGAPVDTNPTYTETSLSDADEVSLVVTSSDACVTSATATSNIITMTVNPAMYPYVYIVSDDADNTICGATPVTFTANAIDQGSTPTYQWKINGVDVGTNSPTFTATGLADKDTVYVVMTSSAVCADPPVVNSDSIVIYVNSFMPLTLSKVDECGSFTGTGSISFTTSSGMNVGYNSGATYTGAVPPIGTTVAGVNTITGLTGGQYTVSLYDPGNGCNAEQTITLNTNVKPAAYTVTGGGGLCMGDGTTAPIGVANSEAGVLYKYIHNSTDTSAAITGTGGSNISFPASAIPGAYIVYAYSVGDSTCKTDMNGTATIVINPKPVIDSVKTNCTGGAGTGSITVYAKITSGTLQYSINGTTFQASATFNNVVNGSYTVYVRETTTQCADTAFGVSFFCNSAPIAYGDFHCNPVDGTVTGNALANDADPDGNVMKVTAQTSISTLKGGTFSIDTLGAFTYKPAIGFVGFDTISYNVCDSVPTPLCVTGTIIIKTGTGGIYANDDVANINMNETFSSFISILANDSTSDGDSIYVSVVTNVNTTAGGKISINSLGNYHYEPAPGFFGTDTYTYTIFDRCGNSAQAKIIINVKEVITVTIFIPEGFSPNGDGSHDYFVLDNTEGYGQISLKIFNRWGSLVYDNGDYKGPDWWDGTSNNGLTVGERLPDGTYFYEIRTERGDKYVNYITLKR